MCTPVPEDPFRGELKCVQVDENDVPVVENDLKIEATIVHHRRAGGAPAPATTAAAYNGIGFEAQSQAGRRADGSALPRLAAAGSWHRGRRARRTYAPCPGVLILDHFFDGAQTELGSFVTTDLTLVPCSEDLGNPANQANF